MFDNWVAACPLHYTSPNAPKKRDVLGTMVLSILAGHRSHHGGARGWRQPAGDGASEDAVRRALKKMPERRSGCAAISTRRRCWEFRGFWTWIPWSSRCLAIRKEQWSAIIRTSRAGPLHTYWVAGLRLVLDVKAGNEHASAHSAPALWGLLDRLGRWPWLLRGDADFWTERIMRRAEQEGMPYLFKLRSTRTVKRLIEKAMGEADWLARAGRVRRRPCGCRAGAGTAGSCAGG